MNLIELKLNPKYLMAGGIVALVLGIAVWNYISLQSKLTTALKENVTATKKLEVCSSNYTGVDNSLSKIHEQIKKLEEENKTLENERNLSKQRVDLIRKNYDSLLQKVEKAPTECKAAMQWLRDQSQR